MVLTEGRRAKAFYEPVMTMARPTSLSQVWHHSIGMASRVNPECPSRGQPKGPEVDNASCPECDVGEQGYS